MQIARATCHEPLCRVIIDYILLDAMVELFLFRTSRNVVRKVSETIERKEEI